MQLLIVWKQSNTSSINQLQKSDMGINAIKSCFNLFCIPRVVCRTNLFVFSNPHTNVPISISSKAIMNGWWPPNYFRTEIGLLTFKSKVSHHTFVLCAKLVNKKLMFDIIMVLFIFDYSCGLQHHSEMFYGFILQSFSFDLSYQLISTHSTWNLIWIGKKSDLFDLLTCYTKKALCGRRRDG